MSNIVQGISQFLSTPSARRATCGGKLGLLNREISIHALREEGDDDFYNYWK